eukprot:TRINITY_DN36807_c0_g1_i1.p1 TRINITY_DN36807_c0_g1~~TRINITY_DN36807_c0_g1_i1.p1  ORF type:complete len:109 (+),score=9.35 TRINITY_DN36807_c0_g1_i1:1-327(+)
MRFHLVALNCMAGIQGHDLREHGRAVAASVTAVLQCAQSNWDSDSGWLVEAYGVALLLARGSLNRALRLREAPRWVRQDQRYRQAVKIVRLQARGDIRCCSLPNMISG